MMSPAPRVDLVARWAPAGGAPSRRLVLFPHAGAGGLAGRALAAGDVEVLVHRRPGREARMAEPPHTTVAESVAEALEALVPVLDGDDAAALAGRVLKLEHRMYPAAVRWFVSGQIAVEGSRVRQLAGESQSFS